MSAAPGIDMQAATLQTLNEAFLVSAIVLLIALPFSFILKGVQNDKNTDQQEKEA